MLSQKHLVDASVDTFASENWLATGLNLQIAAYSTRVASFCPFSIASGPHQSLTAFHIKNHVFAIAKAFKNIILFFSMQSSEW